MPLLPFVAIRVLLIIVFPIERRGIELLVSNSPAAMQVVGNMGSAAEALSVTAGMEADVLVVDSDLSDILTRETVKALCAQLNAQLVVLAPRDEPDLQRAAMEAGAAVVASKQNPPQQLLDAILRAHSGQV